MKRTEIKVGSTLMLKPRFWHYAMDKYVMVVGFYDGVPDLAICQGGHVTESRAIWGFAWDNNRPPHHPYGLSTQFGVGGLREYYDVVSPETCFTDAMVRHAKEMLSWLETWQPSRRQEIGYWRDVQNQWANA